MNRTARYCAAVQRAATRELDRTQREPWREIAWVALGTLLFALGCGWWS